MKILFITRFDFLKDKKDGGLLGSYRNYTLLERIYGKEAIRVCIVSPGRNRDGGNVKYFQSPSNIFCRYLTYLCLKDRIYGRTEKEIASYINKYEPDLLFYDGSTFGQITGRLNPVRKQVVYFHNIERQYTWEQVKKYSLLCIFRYFATRYNENSMVKNVKNRICVNERDAVLLEKMYQEKCNFILPATFADTYGGCGTEESERKTAADGQLDLLFVGSWFAHNYKGLLWFIEEVLPEVDARLTVVGKGTENLKKRLRGKNNGKIVVAGTVENLGQYYAAADAVVMPVFMGGGIKVKTAEAMMYGKTIFASTEALLGYEVRGVNHIYACDTKEQYINRIQGYGQEKNRRKCNQEVRELFLAKYCTENYVERFKAYLDSIDE